MRDPFVATRYSPGRMADPEAVTTVVGMGKRDIPEHWTRITGCMGLKESGKAQVEIGETYARLGLPFGCARERYGQGWALYRVQREGQTA